MPDTTYSHLRYATADGVATITLARPEVRNAVTAQTLHELVAALEAARVAPDVRAILFTGAGGHFCAGADLKAALGAGRPLESLASETAGTLHQAITAIHRMPKPVVSAVPGTAAGAGVGLAISADLVLVGESSVFKLAYSAIGLAPDGGSTWLLPRLVGPKVAADLLMTNRPLGAAEALARGMVSRVVPDDELAETAAALARELAAGATLSFVQAKRLLRQSFARDLETQLEDETEGVRRTVVSADLREGVMAFLQKRAPKFEGR